jgi:hypothetical protein
MSLDENIKYYADIFKDSVILDKKFVYHDLSYCCATYKNQLDNCIFYAGGIYHSEDLSVQFIRLYQEGSIDNYDLMIKETDEGYFTIAFG